MKTLAKAILVLLLIGAAVAAGVIVERKHADGAFKYPWESQSSSLRTSSGSKAKPIGMAIEYLSEA